MKRLRSLSFTCKLQMRKLFLFGTVIERITGERMRSNDSITE